VISPMPRLRRLAVSVALASCALAGAACKNNDLMPAQSALCTPDVDNALNCGVSPDGGAQTALVGFYCPEGIRPDQDPTYNQGVPRGKVCNDSGGLTADGKQGWCCNDAPSTCAYDPADVCKEQIDAMGVKRKMIGYQCRGANRPEAINPNVDCGNGVREDDLINFCCTSHPTPPPPLGAGCVQSDGQCTGKKEEWKPDRMSGWTCTGGAIPSAEDFKANESRADFYYFMCATPTPAPNPNVQYFCCIVPALAPPGGSCVTDYRVPGCAANRFGFACYGRDTPEQNYSIMRCDPSPQQGLSAENYPASLYCCDIKPIGESG